MATKKVTVTIPEELLEEIRAEAAERGLSAYVADIGKDEARRLLADSKLHGHKYVIDAVLAVIAREQKGQVTVFTSDVDDLETLAAAFDGNEAPAAAVERLELRW